MPKSASHVVTLLRVLMKRQVALNVPKGALVDGCVLLDSA